MDGPTRNPTGRASDSGHRMRPAGSPPLREHSATTKKWPSHHDRRLALECTLVPHLLDALRAAGAGDVLVVVGGVIPDADHQLLRDAGVAGIYSPGTNIPAAAAEVLALLRAAWWPDPLRGPS